MASALYCDPYRDHIWGPEEKDTVWKDGHPPDYSVVNKLFEEGRTHVWERGTYEEKVQRLLKSWEMELNHKPRPQDQKTINHELFMVSVNGKPGLTSDDMKELGGSYNVFLATNLPPEYRIYDPDKNRDQQVSYEKFMTVFPKGFAIEVLEVYSQPDSPLMAYKFRHWSYMDGPFQGHAPTHDLVQFFGTCIFHLDAAGKIGKVEIIFERGDFLAKFLEGAPLEGASAACPFLNNQAN